MKQAGGKWYRRRKVWALRYAQVVALNLEPRIVEEASTNSRYLYGVLVNTISIG